MKLDQAQILAYPRKLVEHVILDLYDQINVHLVKMVGFDFPPELQQHFRRERKNTNRTFRLRFDAIDIKCLG